MAGELTPLVLRGVIVLCRWVMLTVVPGHGLLHLWLQGVRLA